MRVGCRGCEAGAAKKSDQSGHRFTWECGTPIHLTIEITSVLGVCIKDTIGWMLNLSILQLLYSTISENY